MTPGYFSICYDWHTDTGLNEQSEAYYRVTQMDMLINDERYTLVNAEIKFL